MTDEAPDQPVLTPATTPPQTKSEKVIERDDLPPLRGWRSHKKAIMGWSGGLLAAVLVALVVPPLQSVINGGVDAATGREPYTLNVRLGAEDVALPRAYEDDPRITGDSVYTGDGSYYFEPGKLRNLGTPPVIGRDLGCNATHEWSTKNGGLDFNATVGEVIITARKALVVRGASITKDRQIIETPGDLAACLIGGPLGAQYLAIDLDEGTVSNLKADSIGEREIRAPVGFQLQPGESERVVFIAQSGRTSSPQENTSLVKWKLVFDALVDGERQEITIGNQDGSPFLTVLGNSSDQTVLVYRADQSAWSSLY